jgi:cytochrome c
MLRAIAVALLSLLLASPVCAAGNPGLGKAIFQRCAMCHTAEKGAGNRLGPNLFGIVGRKSGSVPGFFYSPAMKRANLVWTPANLDAYITKPGVKVPGNRMAFSGIPQAGQRADLIAYLSTLK